MSAASTRARSWYTIWIPASAAARGEWKSCSTPRTRTVPWVGRWAPDITLSKRRLAGAVVADEGDDLAGVDVEVDVVERLDEAVVLLDAA